MSPALSQQLHEFYHLCWLCQPHAESSTGTSMLLFPTGCQGVKTCRTHPGQIPSDPVWGAAPTRSAHSSKAWCHCMPWHRELLSRLWCWVRAGTSRAPSVFLVEAPCECCGAEHGTVAAEHSVCRALRVSESPPLGPGKAAASWRRLLFGVRRGLVSLNQERNVGCNNDHEAPCERRPKYLDLIKALLICCRSCLRSLPSSAESNAQLSGAAMLLVFAGT